MTQRLTVAVGGGRLLDRAALAGVELPEPGHYTLFVELDGQPALSAPLAVISLKTDGGMNDAGVDAGRKARGGAGESEVAS